MIFVFIILSLISSWIWIYYFKEIKIIGAEKVKSLLLTFSLGAIVYLINYKIGSLLNQFNYLDRNVLNQLIDSVLRKGFLSEVLKLIPIYIVYRLFKEEINEPISIFLFFTVSALGFSFSENIGDVISKDLKVFNERAILNTLNEIFCSSLVSFSVINFRFYSKKMSDVVLLLLLTAFLAGFYHFWLYFERLNQFGIILSILYFMVMISVFSTGLTNSINISSDFSYLKIEGNKKIFKRIILTYFALIFIQFVSLSIGGNLERAFYYLLDTLWFSGIIIFIAAKRISKLKLIEGKWSHPKLELPFSFYYSDSFNGRHAKLKLKFKGETFNENVIDFYLKVYCSINPLSKRNSYILKSQDVFLAEKIFLKSDETFYIVHIVKEDKIMMMLLKPKTSGKNLVKRKHAIAALLAIPEGIDISDKRLTSMDFIFKEWVFVKYR